MKYVRVRFDEDEYKRIKFYADVFNKNIIDFIREVMLVEHKQTQLYALLHQINTTLRLIAKKAQEREYVENDVELFNYLCAIENKLDNIADGNYSQ